MVVEVKTTEVYAIKTATLLNYINELISQKTIKDPDQALGLYVVGRPDPELRQLENAIVAEKKTHQLRIVSAGSLLSLAEMMTEYDVTHEDILGVLRPSTARIDSIVDLIERLVAEPTPAPAKTGDTPSPALEEEQPAPAAESREKPVYWLTPVKSVPDETAEECIAKLVGKEHIYAFGENTQGQKKIKPGDWISFYANGKGVVAHAKVASLPENKPHKAVRDAQRHPWVFRVSNPKLYLESPVVIDADLRSRLDAFKDRDPGKSWAWFVQGTSRVTGHDFAVLTRSETRS